jgi:hypothetical protein
MRALRQTIGETSGAQVVTGDLNATRDHGPFRHLLDAGLTDAADAQGSRAWPGMTWPADRAFPPVMRLDHVASAGLGVQEGERRRDPWNRPPRRRRSPHDELIRPPAPNGDPVSEVCRCLLPTVSVHPWRPVAHCS